MGHFGEVPATYCAARKVVVLTELWTMAGSLACSRVHAALRRAQGQNHLTKQAEGAKRGKGKLNSGEGEQRRIQWGHQGQQRVQRTL